MLALQDVCIGICSNEVIVVDVFPSENRRGQIR